MPPIEQYKRTPTDSAKIVQKLNEVIVVLNEHLESSQYQVDFDGGFGPFRCPKCGGEASFFVPIDGSIECDGQGQVTAVHVIGANNGLTDWDVTCQSCDFAARGEEFLKCYAAEHNPKKKAAKD